MKDKKIIIKNCMIPTLITILIMLFVMIWLKMAPFGTNSFASRDAEVQYLDFYGYLQNVLKGEDSIFYTYNSTLGGTGIGIFSYYLASPLNILVVLFSKSQFLIFFNFIFLLKLALCAFTFAYYLQKRFENKLKTIFIILLSLSYAFMQYNLWQASNIMWIDGVYMLPLICLGIYKCIREKKIGLLSISVGLSIIFNWYSGGINCIFAIFWFVVEEVLFLIENKENILKTAIKDILRYGLAMMIGVMISAAIFAPSVLALRSGVGNGFDWDSLKNEFSGNITSSISTYFIGAQSDNANISIYCGSIPLIGAIEYFLIKNKDTKKKIVLLITLIMSIMFLYYQPFVLAFSLLKNVYSFWCRYSYVTIFTLIFVSAHYYQDLDDVKKEKRIMLAAAAFAFILLSLNFLKGIYNNQYLYFTAIAIVISSILIYLIKENIEKEKLVKILSIITLLISSTELLFNAKALADANVMKNGNEYSNYVREQEKQIKDLKEMDSSAYRIAQTRTRNFTVEKNYTANYNESLNFNYMTNTGYTSCPDNSTLGLLDRLGYKTEGYRITVTNTSLIGSDSLLGIKYILSPFEINGLEKVDSIKEANGKYVYYNPYCLSMALKYYEDYEEIEYNNNTFEYQNELYSKLLGRKVEVYKKAEYQVVEKSDNKIIYNIKNKDTENPLYGNLPWIDVAGENINVNDIYNTNYASWLSPSIFYIPLNEGENTAVITVTSEDKISISKEQFYYLDLSLLKTVTEELNNNKAEQLSLNKNGKIYSKIESDKDDECMLINIPYASGFKIYRNGEVIDATKFADCLFSVPLVEGENEITIKYTLPGFKKGMLVSVFGIILLIGYEIIRKIIKNSDK